MAEDQSGRAHSQADTSTQAEQRADQLIQSLTAGEFAGAFELFSDEVQAELVDDVESMKSLIRPQPASILEDYWHGMTSLYGSFEGVGEIESTATEEGGVASLPLEFDRRKVTIEVDVDSAGDITEVPVGKYELPSYADESRFTEREVVVETQDLSLDATLTLPVDDEQVPGVVLVHGAGEVDRDYTAGATKILKDLAVGLAASGIASLRYDKRNYVADIPPEEVAFETVVTGDAVTAVDTLRGVEAVDADRVFVVGHSLGGTCAPYIADEHDDVAGIVNLDGDCIKSLSEKFVDRTRDYWAHRDADSEYGQEQIDRMEALTERLDSGQLEADEEIMGMPAAWEKHLKEYTEDWISTTRSLSVPFLILKTGRLAPKVSAGAVADLRATLPGDGLEIKYFEDLNHYFQRGDRVPNLIFEPELRRPPDEGVISDIVGFIDQYS